MEQFYSSKQAIIQINKWSKAREPFIFIIDFEMTKIRLYRLDELPNNIKFEIANPENHSTKVVSKKVALTKDPISYKRYLNAYEKVLAEIKAGNSYLLNLTYQNPINCNLSLNEIYHHAIAKYKLLVENEFVVFSPESFVKIEGNKIYTFPMKGTVNAKLPGAKEILLSNKKEIAEHATITDLLRNDLSMVAKNVRVEKYMYLDKIKTNTSELYQASTKISGELPKDHLDHLGDIILKLLPAGSITGAPKKKTVEIIQAVEAQKRNYYTGVFGVFDGRNLDSAVMIRYIENQNNQLYYRSGGGITFMSDAKAEYQEMIDKIYVPIFRNNKNTASENTKLKMAQSENQ